MAVCIFANASELTYAPINPTFGGNPNNAPGLLSIAQVQNGYKAPAIAAAAVQTPVEKFNQYLSSLVLTRLGGQTLATLFGTTNTLNPGSYDAVGYKVVVTQNTADGTMTITTTDKSSGAVSSFVISSTGQL